MDVFSNEEGFVKVANYLLQQNQKNNLGIDIARSKPTPSELYVNREIVAGGTQSLLTGASVQEVGVTNFDGNRLEDGRYFVASEVTVQYGEAATGTKLHNVNFGDNLPPQLKAANLIIKQNNEIVVKLPVRSIQNAKKSDAYYRKLDALALIKPQHSVSIEIEFPMDSTITPTNSSAKSFVNVTVKGFETYVKR